MNGLSRRLILKLFGTFGLINVSASVRAITLPDSQWMINLEPLINVLRATEHPVCVRAARQLNSSASQAGFSLHLRNAGLTGNDLRAIAMAIHTVHGTGIARLKSFSVSYNPRIDDADAVYLFKVLPNTVTEIGLVGCGLEDIAANAIQAWVKDASNLHWLCVEDNSFSEDAKDALKGLSREKSGLLVVV